MNSKVSLLTVLILLLGSVYLGCNSNMIPDPLSSKTTDLKTFRFENGKLIEKDPVFQITRFEYEKTEDEKELEFVQWLPEPLTKKNKLTKFWEKNIPKQYDIYRKPMPEGWSLHTHHGLGVVLDTNTGEYLDLLSGGDFFDTKNKLSLGYTMHFNWYTCFNRVTKEKLWEYDGQGYMYYIINGQIYSSEFTPFTYFLKQHSVNNNAPYWSITDKRSGSDKKQFNNIYGSDKGKIIFYFKDGINGEGVYRLCSYAPGSDEIIEYAQLPAKTNIYHYKNHIYYIDKENKMYSINDTTFEKSFVFDFKEYTTGQNYTFENHDYDEISPLICLKRTNDSLLYNVETKTISKPLPKNIQKYNGNYCHQDLDKMYGIDPITFENSWTIDLNDLNIEKPFNVELLLIDSRGVLIKNEDMVYGFKP